MRNIYFAILVALTVAACDKEEQIPSYVRVENITVNEPEGSGFHKFTEGWFYANGVFLGAYTLPADIPVLEEGKHEILVFPGVKENGVLILPNIYPMMTWYETEATLTPGKSVTIQPSVAYDPLANFPWPRERGTFDANSTVVVENLDIEPDLDYEITDVDGFSGNYLLMQVDTSSPIMDIALEATILPTQAIRQTWLEMHHQSDVSFELWLLGQTPGQPIDFIPFYTFNPTEEWNKIYFNLTEVLSNRPHSEYRLMFRLVTDPVNGSPGSAKIDNIHLVHF